jgi:hypothetical protein
MSLIQCPECGSRISDKARTCSVCGYESFNSLVPIGDQEVYVSLPYDETEDNRWDIVPLSQEDASKIARYISKYENLRVIAPGIASAIESMFSTEYKFVADINEYTKELIRKGDLIFSYDKSGNMLPQLKNGDTKRISQLIRLKEVSNNPVIGDSLNNLSNQAALAQIMEELETIEEKIANIQKEMQEDRLAMADSAWDKVLQARNISDYRLRTVAIQNAINSATDAKRVLMRNFAVSFAGALNSGKYKEMERNAQNAAKDLVALTNCVRIECDGYVFIGEYNASKECLSEFLRFIKENKLNDADTLLKLNSCLPAQSKMNNLPSAFIGVVNKLQAYVSSLSIDAGPTSLK